MNFHILVAAGGIALVDMVLSGDNALVIGAAASKLPRAQRLVAIVWGGVGAIFLRLFLAIVATELLTVKYLQAAGGIILFIIIVRLLSPEKVSTRARPASDRFLGAIVTIMVADITMSLDNVLAVGALAAGNIPLLIAGLVFSMALLFVASTLVARLMEYFTWLLDIAALILGWTAANLVLADPAIRALMAHTLQPQHILAIHFGALAIVILIDLFLRARAARRMGHLNREAELVTSARLVMRSPTETSEPAPVGQQSGALSSSESPAHDQSSATSLPD